MTEPAEYHRSAIGQKRARAWMRLRVLIAYSDDPPCCACCGESYLSFLGLDHIHGGGTQHRRSTRGYSYTYGMYKELIDNNFPPGYRVLCHNCNVAFARDGYCPHEHDDYVGVR